MHVLDVQLSLSIIERNGTNVDQNRNIAVKISKVTVNGTPLPPQVLHADSVE